MIQAANIVISHLREEVNYSSRRLNTYLDSVLINMHCALQLRGATNLQCFLLI